MAKIDISSYTSPVMWKYGGATAKLRLYATKQFVASDDAIIMPSRISSLGWYREIDCTVAGSVLTVGAALNVDSTTDSLWDSSTDEKPPRYIGVFYDANGIRRDLFGQFRIPPTPDPTTWADILIYNHAAAIELPDTYYTADQVNALLNDLDTAPDATDVVKGKVLIEAGGNGTVVSTNSTQLTKNTKVLGIDYATLAAAVTAIGSTPTTLKVKSDLTVSASTNLAVSAPGMILEISDGALITVNSGQTLTIDKMVDPGNRKVFAGAGTVRVMPRAVERINVAWWAGTDTSVEQTTAFQAAFANLTANDGGTLFIPEGLWKVKELTIPSNAIIEGAGIGRDGVKGTTLQLANLATASYILKVSEAFRQITIRDFTASVHTSTTSSAFLIEGTVPNTGTGLEVSNVQFHGYAADAPPLVHLKDLGGEWECVQVNFHHCNWIVQPGVTGFRSDTVNTGLNFTQPFFYMGGNATGMYLSSANVNISNPTFNGTDNAAGTFAADRTVTGTIAADSQDLTLTSGTFEYSDLGQKIQSTGGALDTYIIELLTSTTARVQTAPETTVTTTTMEIFRALPSEDLPVGIRIAGSHGTIALSGSQDEALSYSLIVSGLNQVQYPIRLDNCNFQSHILLESDCTIVSTACDYKSNTFMDATGVRARIVSVGDYVDRTSMLQNSYFENITLTVPRLFGQKDGDTIVQTELTVGEDHYRHRFGLPTDFIFDYGTYISTTLTDEPVVQIGSGFDTTPHLRIGKLDPVSGRMLYYYDFRRDDSGRLEIAGSQAGFIGVDFNSDVKALSFTTPPQTLVSSATIAVNAALSDFFILEPNHDATLNITGLRAGQTIKLFIRTINTTSRTLTFGTGFKSSGTLATGVLSGKYFSLIFLSDGTAAVESPTRTGL